MKFDRTSLAAGFAAAVLALGSAGAWAQPRGDQGPQRHERYERHDRDGRHERHDRGHAYRDGAHGHRGAPPRAHPHWHEGRDHRHAPPAVRHGPPRHAQGLARGAGPRHDLYKGARLPVYYRTPHYVVRDWRAHRLGPPPRGYHWVQAGADYVLVAIGTGVILQVVLGW